MGICDPVILNCDVCYEITVPINNMNVQAALTPASTPYLWIIDKWDKKYKDKVTINNDGSFDIIISNFPEGLFNQAVTNYDIFLSSDVDGLIVIPIVFSFIGYNCIILTVDWSNDCPAPTPINDCQVILNSIPDDLKNTCVLPTYDFADPNVTENLTPEQIEDLQFLISGDVVKVVVIEDILKYDVVNGDGSKANSSIIGKRNRVIGLAISNIANGFSGDVQQDGEIMNIAWSWTKGLPVYLNGTGLSHTSPVSGFIQKIGIAINTNTIEISINQSILI